MADTYKVNFKVKVTPIETLEDENLGTHPHIAGEIGKSLGGGGDSVALTDFNTRTAANQGYLNQTVNYVDVTHATGGTPISAGYESDFFFIKNTGYKYSSPTALGASTTDCVLIVIILPAQSSAVRGGWKKADGTSESHYIELAWLKPKQGTVLPTGCKAFSITQFGSAANDLTKLNENSGADGEWAYLYGKTIQSDGSAATDGNAVEFLALD